MKKLYITTALTLLASPALAELAPAALWQSWQQDFANMGVALTAEPEQQGNVLVLHNAKFEIEIGPFRIDQTLTALRMEALEDGSIAVDYTSPLTMSMDITGGFEQSLFTTGEMKNASATVTGSLDDYVFAFAYGEITQAGEMRSQQGGTESVLGSMAMTMRDMVGRQHVVHTEAGVSLTYDFTMGALDNTQTISTLQQTNMATTQTTHTTGESYEGAATVFFPAPVAGSQNGSLIPDGFLLDASLALIGTVMSQTTDTSFYKINMNVTEEQSHYLFNVDEGSANLQFDSQNAVITMIAPQISAAPLVAEIADTSMSLALPLHPSDTPQDASFAMRLDGLTVNDAVWAMADPEGSLSHAPATLAIDTRASVTLLLDWTDIEALKASQGAPLVLHNVKLQDFLVAFENARLTGAGTVDFSNETPDPVPNGGRLTFSFEGVLALLDKLGTLPLVDPSMTAGAKGMLGMFTTGSTPDSLTSEIIFSEGGHVAINGMQVR